MKAGAGNVVKGEWNTEERLKREENRMKFVLSSFRAVIGFTCINKYSKI